MKFKNEVYNIALSGILLGLAIVIGKFATFPLLGGQVYLVGMVVFIMPIILPLYYAFLTASLAVIISDVLSGWAAYCWISFLAYGVAVILIWLSKKMKRDLIVLITIVFASFIASTIYLSFEWIVFDKAQGVADFIATLIEFAIVDTMVIAIYYPLKKIRKE